VKGLSEIVGKDRLIAFVSRLNRLRFVERGGNVKLVMLPYSNERRSLRHISQQLLVPWLAVKHGADIFFAPGNTAPLLTPVPVVLSVKTMHAFTSPEGLGRSRIVVRRTMQSLAALKAKRIITNSSSNRSDVHRYLRVPLERIHVIPEGLDHGRFYPRSLREALGGIARWNLSQPFLLYVSGLWPYKNVELLIESFALFAKRGRAVSLVIAGEGFDWYAKKLHALVARAGVGERVRFLGRVDNTELPFLYSAALAVVLPSRYETFGRVVAEAMACGTPTASANTSSLPEVVGDAGLLFDPGDAPALADLLSQLTDDEGLRHQLKERGLRRAHDFTWERTVQDTYEILAKTVADGQHR
jgi:glycosyltransferase involved in cell wall biosynthesis